ncbi:MAG: hypothetical protein ACXWWQ_07460, partial [Candidatus Limnocylindria bacterium]
APSPTPTAAPASLSPPPEPTTKPTPVPVSTGTLGNWAGSGPAYIEVTGTEWTYAEWTWSCSAGTFAMGSFASSTNLRNAFAMDLTQEGIPPIGPITVSADPSCDWRLALWGRP